MKQAWHMLDLTALVRPVEGARRATPTGRPSRGSTKYARSGAPGSVQPRKSNSSQESSPKPMGSFIRVASPFVQLTKDPRICFSVSGSTGGTYTERV